MSDCRFREQLHRQKWRVVADKRYRGGFQLNFLDDGCGMDPVELSQVIQFGRSMKRNSGSNQIGQYGNGLKSGSMRIGKDMILLTKKGSTMSCLFLSRSFHEQENIHEVIVPMPSWNSQTGEPLAKDDQERKRYEIEMEIILKHSPFRTEKELLDKFNEIDATTGTLVIIFNLKLLDNGESELDLTSDAEDILMRDPHANEDVPPERTSFRSYTAVLYSEPRMRIFIQKKKVRTKRLVNSVFKPISYSYTSNRFRTRSEKEVEKAEYEAKIAEEKAKELSIQAKEALPRDNLAAKNNRHEGQVRQMKAEQAKIDAEVKRRIAEEKKKSLKEPKQLTFTFGFNINARKCDGMYIYNCNRLIRMCEKIGPQLEGGVKCAGIIGIVDVPYLVLEPTHNKQDFADAKEYKHLLRSMAEHMLQYWKDSKIEEHGVTAFWEEFGYTGRWRDDASNESKFLLKRAMSVPLCVQCDSCLKWRQLQFSRKLSLESVPEFWVCSMNTDNNFKTCTKPEQKPNIQAGRLQKDIKSVEQRAEQDIKRLTDKLKKAEKIAARGKPSPPPPPPTTTARRPVIKPTFAPKPSPPPRRSPITNSRSSSKASTTPKAVQKALKEISSPAKKTASKKNEERSRKVETEGRKKYSTDRGNGRVEQSKRRRSPSPPPKKATPSSAKSTKKTEPPAKKEPAKKRAVVAESDEEEDVKPVNTKRKKTAQPETTEENVATSSEKVDSSTTAATEEPKNEAKTTNEEPKFDTVYQLDTRVEAKVNTRWYAGKVISLKHGAGLNKIKVKFDLHSQDKFDKWFSENDKNLRLLEEDDTQPADAEGTQAASPTNNNEISSSIASPSSTNEDRLPDNDKLRSLQELLDGVVQKFRRCLHYFRPPDFVIEKHDILHNLTPYDLRDFDLGRFVADYERSIRKLVGTSDTAQHKVKEEAEKQIQELIKEKEEKDKELEDGKKKLDDSKEELRKLRQNVNVLIKSIGAQIEPEDDSEHVDTLLSAIVQSIGESS
eukprot:gene7744-13577_t